MENYSLLMGAASVMKMTVEMAGVDGEAFRGTSRPGGVRTRLLSPDLGFAMAAALEGIINKVAWNIRNYRYVGDVSNYDEMHAIFSFVLAIGKFAMGSSESLGTPSAEDDDTQDSDTVILDGPPEKAAGAPERTSHMPFGTTYKPTNMHHDLYQAVMDMVGFVEEDLMAALSHLVDHKAQGSSFVGMNDPHSDTAPSGRGTTLPMICGVLTKGFRNLQLMEDLLRPTDQVSGYSNNSYRGYETLEAARQEYQSFLDDETAIKAIDQPMP
ncbi:hypothetical protein QYE76_052713 [Lolium multiflorum]|uniref:Uncharacterized protein n=1 Tax=Lolium multiflorum TaxID=4521 RepID=A0AAD8WJE9_LOLMU|nr:hypothetical protein QYE76_052713 [Lolium multiflorum]